MVALERSLVYVSGKGGAGKTTVSACLQIAATQLGRRAVVCDVASLVPHDALVEWMHAQPGGAIAAPVLGRSQAFTQFVEAAPGAKELITVGKFVDLARAVDVDTVIVDAPSTGHALAMLSAAQTVGRIASHGPVGAQARGLHAYLTDRQQTAYVGVTLPEEMALRELLDLDAGLHRVVGRGLDLVVVNAVFPDRLTEGEAERLRPLAGESGAIRAALREHQLGELHALRTAWLRERVAAPLVTLPFVFTTEIGPRELEQLAERFRP
jgi:anion-transporting  ArsA/GET3 family ATPase